MLSGIKHISFDLWLTLIRSNAQFKPARNKLFAQYFSIRKPDDEIAKAFRHYDLLFNKINEQTGRNVHYSEILLVILDKLDVDISDLSVRDMEGYYNQMEALFFDLHPLLIEEETGAILQSIQAQNITMNILSNTGFILGTTLRKLLRHLDIDTYFSFQLYSDEMGYSKPSERVFEEVYVHARQINVTEKQQILHVGDNAIADYRGAKNFGFQAQLIDAQQTLRNLF